MCDFDKIVTAVRKQEIVLFLGAGIHYQHEPKPPTTSYYTENQRPRLGGEFAEHLAIQSHWNQRFPNTTAKQNFARVTLDYELFITEDQTSTVASHGPSPALDVQTAQLNRQAGRRQLGNEITRAVQLGFPANPPITPSPLLRLLASLGFPIVVTTNYDSHYESTLSRMPGNLQPVVTHYHPNEDNDKREYPLGSDPTPQKPFIYKIHGDIADPTSLVITDEDYIDFVLRMTEKDRNPVPGAITFRLSRWPTLFLGYSLADYNLRLLLKTLHHKKDHFPFKSYSVSPYPDPLISRVWQDEKSAIGFLPEDIWDFLPRLYKSVTGNEFIF